MSFFFTNQKAKATKRTSTPKVSTASSKDTLNRLGCKACPLREVDNCSPRMPPQRGNQPIYFLGGSPSRRDDEKGTPFSDKAGQLLRDLIDPQLKCHFDNVIRDYSDEPVAQPWVPMECCRSRVVKSIEEAKPVIIVGLGIQALQWMLNSSDMVGLRGRLFAVKVGNHPCYFLPTYDPAYVIEKAFDKDEPIKGKFGHCLKFDIQRAVNYGMTLTTPQIDTPEAARAAIQTFNGHGPNHLGQVLDLIRQARKARQKAIDIETHQLRPYHEKAAWLTCAISFKDVNFSFAIDHPKAGWNKMDLVEIKEALIELLCDEDVIIIAHNTPFEVEWLACGLGRDAIIHENWDDTMMQAHFIDERRGKRGGNDDQFQPNPYQALDFLVRQYFGLSYKPLFKLDRKNMIAADLDETLLYNGADTKYTLRLFQFQQWIMEDEGLLEAYEEARERQPTVALMQKMGIHVDQEQNKAMQLRLGKEIAEIEAQINELPEVQKYIRDWKSFNVASTPELIRLLKDYVKVGKAILDENGKETTDKGALDKITHPIGKLVQNYRNRAKLKSTYVDVFEMGRGDFIWPDGLLHPSFNTTFSETGRTSSDEPNQQNWPSRNDKWVRRQVVAPSGCVLVAFDYGQLEACTTAMCSRDGVLTKALWNDYDIHMEWAVNAVKLFPPFVPNGLSDAKGMKGFRSLIKNKMVFPAFFGAKNESVNGYLHIATGLDVPARVTDRLMGDFWSTFNGVDKWQRQTMKDYYNKGYVESPTGRRRRYPLTKNQAVNYPIQSVACDIVCTAMVKLSKIAAETGKWYLHPIMNIHDDLTFCIPDNDKILEPAIETIYRTMLSPGYDFVNVPLSVSGSIGNNWLEMDEIGKFWSHKDL